MALRLSGRTALYATLSAVRLLSRPTAIACLPRCRQGTPREPQQLWLAEPVSTWEQDHLHASIVHDLALFVKKKLYLPWFLRLARSLANSRKKSLAALRVFVHDGNRWHQMISRKRSAGQSEL